MDYCGTDKERNYSVFFFTFFTVSKETWLSQAHNTMLKESFTDVQIGPVELTNTSSWVEFLNDE